MIAGGSTASVSSAEDSISPTASALAGCANPKDSRPSTLNAAICAHGMVAVVTNVALDQSAAPPPGSNNGANNSKEEHLPSDRFIPYHPKYLTPN